LKQAVAMMFAVNGDTFGRAHPELARFILNKESRDIPNRIRIFLYYTHSPLSRLFGFQAIIRPFTGETILLSEVSHPPFGFVYTVDSESPDNRLFEITGFSRYLYSDKCRVSILPSLLPTDSIYPGDYRPKEQILRDAHG
jgi:hypothetical protein